MSYNTLRYEVADNILTLTLNRPDALNSFTVEMAEELIAAFNRASEDDEVRAVVVTGAAVGLGVGLSQDSSSWKYRRSAGGTRAFTRPRRLRVFLRAMR